MFMLRLYVFFFYKNWTKIRFERPFTKIKRRNKSVHVPIIFADFNALRHIIIGITPITCKIHYSYVWCIALRNVIDPYIDYFNLIFTKHDKIYLWPPTPRRAGTTKIGMKPRVPNTFTTNEHCFFPIRICQPVLWNQKRNTHHHRRWNPSSSLHHHRSWRDPSSLLLPNFVLIPPSDFHHQSHKSS